MNKIFENFISKVEATSIAFLVAMRADKDVEKMEKIKTKMDILVGNVDETAIVTIVPVTLTKDNGEEVIGKLSIVWINNFGLDEENITVLSLELSVEVDGEVITDEVPRIIENVDLWNIAESRAVDAYFMMKNG